MPVIRKMLAALTGYNRPFASLKDAEAAIAGYEGDGHSNLACAINLIRTMEEATASDYAALFYLQPVLPSLRTIFDFGGSIGNLFYCYAKYLDFPADLIWTVFDVPENVDFGEKFARDRGEQRLRFTACLGDGDGVDLFLATGALHYFETPLPDIISEFQKKPRYVLVNRSPMADGRPFATVQDGGVYRVACMLHNRDALIRKFDDAGYEILGNWRAAERSLIIPFYPDRSVHAYSGMFFRLRSEQKTAAKEKTSPCF